MTEQKRTGALEEWRSPLDHLIAELFLSWSFCYSSMLRFSSLFFSSFHHCYHLVFRGKTCCCVCSFSVGVCWLQTLSMISILVSDSILNGEDFFNPLCWFTLDLCTVFKRIDIYFRHTDMLVLVVDYRAENIQLDWDAQRKEVKPVCHFMSSGKNHSTV